jgi:hypothetical protein
MFVQNSASEAYTVQSTGDQQQHRGMLRIKLNIGTKKRLKQPWAGSV